MATIKGCFNCLTANHFARFRTSASAESKGSVSLLGATSPSPTRCATLQGEKAAVRPRPKSGVLRDGVRCAPDLPAIAAHRTEHRPRYASLARFGLDAVRGGYPVALITNVVATCSSIPEGAEERLPWASVVSVFKLNVMPLTFPSIF